MKEEIEIRFGDLSLGLKTILILLILQFIIFSFMMFLFLLGLFIGID